MLEAALRSWRLPGCVRHERRDGVGAGHRARGPLRAQDRRPSCSAGAGTPSATSPTPTSARCAWACPGSLPVLNVRAVEFAMRIGSGPALRDPAVDLPPEELLLSGHAQGLSDQPVRRAHQRRAAGSSCPTAVGCGSSGPTWRRTPARPRTSGEAGASTMPTTPSSTTTAPACRWWRSSPLPTSAPSTQARLYASELRGILVATGASDGRMEEGSMRVDANVSVRPAGTFELGTRCEIKNLNSLRSLGRAIEYEIERQVGLLEAGDKVVQQTRHWNEDTGRDGGAAFEGGGLRLPVLSRARSRARRARSRLAVRGRRLDRAHARGSSRQARWLVRAGVPRRRRGPIRSPPWSSTGSTRS